MVKNITLFIIIVISSTLSFATQTFTQNNIYSSNYEEERSCIYDDFYDPFEKLNRKIFLFNGAISYFILRPVSITYDKVLNQYTKDRVSSFLDNASTPLTGVNNLLQFNLQKALLSFWRFCINSTVGIVGIYDIASKLDLKIERKTFGDTLAYYGAGPGPYIIFPFFVGAGARDVLDGPILNSTLNPLDYTDIKKKYGLGIFALSAINDTIVSMQLLEPLLKNSTDIYAAIRTISYQNREYTIQYPKGYVKKCKNLGK